MKTPEEYLEECYNLHKDEEGNKIYYGWAVKEAIQKAQIDAIEYTVKRCAEEAEIGYSDNSTYPDNIIVSKQSILNVANKIKKELLKGNK